MNRSIALFVALAVLVAHGFAIHNDGSGGLAAPYDSAYVAFRLGRNLVYDGSLAWMPGLPGIDAYPSLLWVGVCALGERLSIGLNPFCQGIGMLAALATLILASRFHPDRIASLIAPLLLAISGGMAAAAVSGTETALLALFATAAFLSFERGWKSALGISLLLAGLTRPEGWFLAFAMGALRAIQVVRARRVPGDARAALGPFLIPASGLMLVAIWRVLSTGQVVSSWSEHLTSWDAARIQRGLDYTRDLFVSTGSPLLLVYALWYLLRGRLSPTGTRALVLFALWCGLIVWIGGGGPIFSESLVPVLPIGLIAAQEGMISALNSTRQWVRGLAWSSFLAAAFCSALASRFPGDLGPIPLQKWQQALYQPSTPSRFGYQDRLGRAGLYEEIERTAYLRGIGNFMRSELDPSLSVLTPWPGSIGYLSRLAVYDMLGRVTPPPGGDRRNHWHGVQRVDVLSMLAKGPDYIVPFAALPARVPVRQDLVTSWFNELDDRPQEPGRRERLMAALEDYELTTVPIVTGGDPGGRRNAAYLLRRRALKLAPVLDIQVQGDEFAVHMRQAGHHQAVDLWVRATTERGRVWYLDPTGIFREDRPLNARSYLLAYPTGERSIELIRARLPRPGPRFIELSAVLRHPEAQGNFEFTFASSETRVELER